MTIFKNVSFKKEEDKVTVESKLDMQEVLSEPAICTKVS